MLPTGREQLVAITSDEAAALWHGDQGIGSPHTIAYGPQLAAVWRLVYATARPVIVEADEADRNPASDRPELLADTGELSGSELGGAIREARRARVDALQAEADGWLDADIAEGRQAPSRELLAARQRLVEARAAATGESIWAETATAAYFAAVAHARVPAITSQDYLDKVREIQAAAATKLDALDNWRAIQEQFYGEALNKLLDDAEAGRRKKENVRQESVTERFWRQHDALLAARQQVLDEIAVARAVAANTYYGDGAYRQAVEALAAE